MLVVARDASLRRALRARAREIGWRCLRAAEAGAALRRASRTRIDLFVALLEPECGDCLGLAAALRRACDPPIIVGLGVGQEVPRLLRTLEDVTVLRQPADTELLVELAEAAWLRRVARIDGRRPALR